MITQEMIDAMARAAYEVAPIGEERNFEWHWIGWENAPQEKLKKQMHSALNAVYPLILEQAAVVCDNWRKINRENNVYYENAGDKETAVVCLVLASMAASCAASIRNLKDKTDDKV